MQNLVVSTGSTTTVPRQADTDEQLIQLWVQRHESPHTRRTYRRTAAVFLSFVGKPLTQVTVGDIQDLGGDAAGTGAGHSRQPAGGGKVAVRHRPQSGLYPLQSRRGGEAAQGEAHPGRADSGRRRCTPAAGAGTAAPQPRLAHLIICSRLAGVGTVRAQMAGRAATRRGADAGDGAGQGREAPRRADSDAGGGAVGGTRWFRSAAVRQP